MESSNDSLCSGHVSRHGGPTHQVNNKHKKGQICLCHCMCMKKKHNLFIVNSFIFSVHTGLEAADSISFCHVPGFDIWRISLDRVWVISTYLLIENLAEIVLGKWTHSHFCSPLFGIYCVEVFT